MMDDLVEYLQKRITEEVYELAFAPILDCPEWWMPKQWSRERAIAECAANVPLAHHLHHQW